MKGLSCCLACDLSGQVMLIQNKEKLHFVGAILKINENRWAVVACLFAEIMQME